MISKFDKQIFLSYIFLVGSIIFSLVLVILSFGYNLFWFELFRLIVYIIFTVLWTFILINYGTELRVAIEGAKKITEISELKLKIRGDIIQKSFGFFNLVYFLLPFVDQFFSVVSIILSLEIRNLIVIGICFLRLSFDWIIEWVIR